MVDEELAAVPEVDDAASCLLIRDCSAIGSSP
jgi:hypothetical protein